MISARAQPLGSRFVRDVLGCHETRAIPAGQQPFCSIDGVDHGRERLVEFVREHGGHLGRCR